MGGSLSDTLDLLRRHTGDQALLGVLICPFFPSAAVSVMTLGILPTTTISATGSLAARIDELQIDLGEGPAWDAVEDALPVLEPDLRDRPLRAWPAFSYAIAQEDVGALFVFPLRVGHLNLGVLTFSYPTPMSWSVEQGKQAGLVAGVVGDLLLRQALERVGDGDDLVPESYSRRSIHQATGMVIIQANVGAIDAELLIRGHAFAENTTMRHVADDILQRRLTFQPFTTGNDDR